MSHSKFSSQSQVSDQMDSREGSSALLDGDPTNNNQMRSSAACNEVFLFHGTKRELLGIFEEKNDNFWKRSLKMPFFVGKNTGKRRVSGWVF